MHAEDAYHFVTNRCEHEQFLMLPTKEINEIILNWLVKAHALHGTGIEIYAFVFLSNHFHMLLKDTCGNLARFMCYFQANVAKEINQHLGRAGKFFAREYDDVIVEGDDSFLNRYAYVMGNAVKAGLVDTSKEWPGLNSLHHTLSDDSYKVTVLNKTKLHNARRNGKNVDISKYMESFEMTLATPPMWHNKPLVERRTQIKELLKSAEHEYHARREYKPALGAQKVLLQKHTDRPSNPARSPRFKFFCLDPARTNELKEIYREFVGAYRQRWGLFTNAARKGRSPTIEWPLFSYPPSSWTPILQVAA
jgi:REP element-mobilizing transposase RayT